MTDTLSRLAMLVHELKQPLTAILSNAQAAQRFLAADRVDLQELREILRDIIEDDKRAAGLVRGIGVLMQETAALRIQHDSMPADGSPSVLEERA